MVYCKAKFGRGTGLGNRLFPWARCLLFANMQNATMLDPLWCRLAIGQLLRGGIDYRSYLRQLMLFGLFKKGKNNLGLLSGPLQSWGACTVDEPADLHAGIGETQEGIRNVTVVFKGWKNFFEPLNGWNEFLHQELRAITKQKYLEIANAIKEVPIGMCVRCGNDFQDTSNDNYEPIGPIDKTPLKWYIESLKLIRQVTGYPYKAYVVSDGTRYQLKELLQVDNVAFVRPGSAISDLLILSKAKVLLTPGASSFASWACFFGQMPSISHPGQPLDTIWRIKNRKNQFIGEFNPLQPSQQFLSQAVEALK